ncbi:MAG: hypothetical protein H7Y32_18215 [Chloroflexales bacterium]|nr:hypothetical protein [Chloroflexales bacterium]
MRSRFRTSLLAGLAALAVALIALGVTGGVGSARAQEPLRPTLTAATPVAATMPALQLATLVALPVTGGDRSSSLVLRAVVGGLLLAVGIMGRLLFRRWASHA